MINHKVLTKGHEFLVDHPLGLRMDNVIYLSIRAMGKIFDIQIDWNTQQEALELSYRDTMKIDFSLKSVYAEQIQFPWIDGYFTILGYLEHWKTNPVSLKAWILDESQWKRLQEGKEVISGELMGVSSTFNSVVEMPYQETFPCYFILYNPHLATSIEFNANLQLQVP